MEKESAARNEQSMDQGSNECFGPSHDKFIHSLQQTYVRKTWM